MANGLEQTLSEVIRRFGEKMVCILCQYAVSLNSLVTYKMLKSVQSALSDLKRPPERLQSQCNYRLFIT